MVVGIAADAPEVDRNQEETQQQQSNRVVYAVTSLDKEATSHDDLFDSFGLPLQFRH
jgi:hypothetical protein